MSSNNAPQGVNQAARDITIFTEDEIEAFNKALAQGFWDWEGKDTPAEGTPPKTTMGCENNGHTWKLYQGFSRAYEYCTKCDLKMDIK